MTTAIKETYLEFFRGDDVDFNLNFSTDGVEIDVSAWTFAGQLRAGPNDEDVAASFAFDMTNASDGIVAVSIDADVMEDLDPTKLYYYDIQRTASARVRTVMRGRFKVIADTTRP